MRVPLMRSVPPCPSHFSLPYSFVSLWLTHTRAQAFTEIARLVVAREGRSDGPVKKPGEKPVIKVKQAAAEEEKKCAC